MIEPQIPDCEVERLRILRALSILDTLPEERFDRYTRLARSLFDVPIALVSLVDAERQWFKSRAGLDATETPRNISFCGHAILTDELMCVPDTLDDLRFADNPLVTGKPGIRFYAGYPLRMQDGSRIGTLCLIDRRPRELGDHELGLLKDLGRMVIDELSALTLATVDELTGLSNRRGFIQVAHKVLANSERAGQSCSLVYADMTDFKTINDTFGHAQGDRALIDFADILLKAFRNSDVIGRLGGDEFAVLASGCEAPELLRCALGRLSDSVDEFNQGSGRPYNIGYSVGCEDYVADTHHGIDALIACADKQMYVNKQSTQEMRMGPMPRRASTGT